MSRILEFPKSTELGGEQRKRTDVAMLDSLSVSFAANAEGYDLLLSFNPQDISELMARCSGYAEHSLKSENR